MSLFGKLFGGNKTSQTGGATAIKPAPAQEENHWQEVYAFRAHLFEQHFGPLPTDILKIMDLSVVWPGGGLYAIPTKIAGESGFIYSTFGLSNPDMPTTMEWADVQFTSGSSGNQRTVGFEGKIRKKVNPRPRTERPGYGYELVVLAKENAEWPLWLLQWAAKAELLKDADFLGVVEKHQGITVEQISIGKGKSVNLLISKAQSPLPEHLVLPSGKMELLVATLITDDEMAWSLTNGRNNLLTELQKAGVGQKSVLDRTSVVRIEEADFAQVTNLEQARELAAKGQLAKLLLFPAEFGGQDAVMNIVYVPPRSVRQRTAHIQMLRAWVQEGVVNSLDIRPEYKGTSFVPSRVHMSASHTESGEQRVLTLEVW